MAVNKGYIDGPRVYTSGKGIAKTGYYLPPLREQNWELSLPAGAQYVSGVDECVKAAREQRWVAFHGRPTRLMN